MKPGHHFTLQIHRHTPSHDAQAGQIDLHIDIAANQMDVHRLMVFLAQLQSVFSAKAFFSTSCLHNIEIISIYQTKKIDMKRYPGILPALYIVLVKEQKNRKMRPGTINSSSD